jgi:2,3-bisphosphoglycerate-independent phosphoglycerate mutase
VQAYYDKPTDSNTTGDEFVPATRIKGTAFIQDGDSVLFFNFRGDRPREITRAFIDPEFKGFPRTKLLKIFYATLTNYEKGLCPNVVFDKPAKMVNILGEWVAKQGIAQFRTAETEKFPHVTFFFNDYREEAFPSEERGMAQSPKEVSTYNQKPEMSASHVTEMAKAAILSGKFGLIVVNYANPDMVGHTGDLAAVCKACEAVDSGLGVLLAAIDQVGARPSSRPTTATPTRCGSRKRTAPTPATRSAPSRSSSTAPAARPSRPAQRAASPTSPRPCSPSWACRSRRR